MKKTLLSVIILLTTLCCFAQQPIEENTISVNIGTSYLARQDLIFSPIAHTDLTFLNVGIAYTRQAKLFQKASLRYANFNPMVSTAYDFTIDGETNTANPHSFNIIDVDYLLGKNLKESEKTFLTAGALFMMDVQSLNYEYGRTSSFGYYSTIGLGAFGRYQYTINAKSNVAATLQLPLVAWLSRSPYLVNDDEFIENTESHSSVKTFISFIGDGEFATWNNLQTFDLDIKYTYNLNEKWSIGAIYLFEFIHSSQPRSLLSYRQSINLSTNFSF